MTEIKDARGGSGRSRRDPPEIEVLRRLYVDEHRSQREIAAMLGFAQSAICNRLARYGITREPERPGVRPPYEIPADTDEESRRVLTYVNGEIERYRTGERTEDIDLICEAAEGRLRS